MDAGVFGVLENDIRMKYLHKSNLVAWYFPRVAIIIRQILFIDMKMGYQALYGINIAKYDM